MKGAESNECTKKANGIDGITSHSLKAGAKVNCDSLAFIMNLPISTGSFINDNDNEKYLFDDKLTNSKIQ